MAGSFRCSVLSPALCGGRGDRGRRVWAWAAAAVLLVVAVWVPGAGAQSQQADVADAVDLGDITGIERSRVNDSLDSVGDPSDAYRFELSAQMQVGLGLRRMTLGADMTVEDANGTVLAAAHKAGTAKEWLSLRLAPGVYFVRVTAAQTGSGTYRLRYGATEPPEPEPETRSEPEPALQATPVWSAEMTVGTYDRYSPPGLGYSTWSRTGALSDRDFELGGTNYRMLALVEQAGGLYLVITREVPVEFTLAVGDQEFAASASSLPATAGSGRYWWDTGSELLAAGDTVNVSLAATDDAAAADRPLAPPGAYFTDIPASHNGTDSLTVKVSFSEEVALTATALRDDALDVSGATVTAVAQRAPASTKAWSVTVQPDGTADVAIGLAITTACDQTGAVCTADGRQLHNQPHSTISGPVTGNLSDLAVSGLDLNPAFDPGETFYTAQAPPDLAQVTVTATTARNDTTIEITPTDTDTTTPGHQVELNTDTDTIIAITTTSPDTAEQYWIAVSPPSENSSPTQPEIDPQLAQLGTLSLHGLPELNFTADQARYELDAPAGLTETIVVANPLFADAAIELLVIRSDDPTLAIDRTAADGLLVATDISLSATGDTALILRVTSPDGQQQNVYAVLIHRAAEAQPSSPGSSWLRQGFASWAPQPKSDITPKTTTPAADDAALSNLSLTGASLAPVFSPTTTAYIAEAAADVQYVTLSITTADAAATTAIWPADADLSTPGWQIPLTAPGIADIATKTMIGLPPKSWRVGQLVLASS